MTEQDQLMVRPRSERVDPTSGITERVRFVGRPGHRIYTVMSLPPGEVVGAVVFVPSLLTDRLRSYRGEVEAARRLAGLGFVVQRFDYRGFGHSDGTTGDATADEMQADLATVLDDLAEVTDAEVTLVGSRFGSLIVANRPLGARRVVLWDPVLTGREYFRAAFRAHMVGLLQHDASESTPSSDLERSGRATVLGYTVSRRLVESANAVSLVPAPALGGVSVLWLESGTELPTPRQKAIDTLRSDGIDLVMSQVPNGDPGWFVGVRPLQDQGAVDALVEWISKEAQA